MTLRSLRGPTRPNPPTGLGPGLPGPSRDALNPYLTSPSCGSIPPRPASLVAQGVDRIQLGGLEGRKKSENDADHGADADGEQNGPRRNQGGEAHVNGAQLRGSEAAHDAENTAEQAEENG